MSFWVFFMRVGALGFEPRASCTPCKRASRSAPRPEQSEQILPQAVYLVKSRLLSFGQFSFQRALHAPQGRGNLLNDRGDRFTVARHDSF